MFEAQTVGRRKKKIALSELGSEENGLRRQRAHDVARTLARSERLAKAHETPWQLVCSIGKVPILEWT
jgi:hypothetical protein